MVYGRYVWCVCGVWYMGMGGMSTVTTFPMTNREFPTWDRGGYPRISIALALKVLV